ncbi:DUF1622 domain-containing protein [Legionella israelensis]|uniref:DUF1622 domain-containing protein n=1 Tax=Legionella israelensis TaxID=454 RepID=UPI00117EDDDA|nr:DUF1622 domain-containing protein [Legionella israelensis]QDP73256.1 DUF1622 domain-containing protein [Legionella israelensis]
MNIETLHGVLVIIQESIALCGVLVISIGVLIALGRCVYYAISSLTNNVALDLNKIRLSLGRVLILGLEFIIAADLISTTTAPDYYTIGLVAIIVLIRTFLSYTLNREINSLIEKESKELTKHI